MNQTFLGKLKKLNCFSAYQWESKVKDTTNACNYSYNRAVGFSPYEIIYKHTMPIKIKGNQITDKIFNHKEMKGKIEKLREKYHVEFNAGNRRAKNDYEQGDVVLHYDITLNCGKLGSRWTEGWKVVEKLGKETYKLTKNDKSIVSNKIYMKKWYN